MSERSARPALLSLLLRLAVAAATTAVGFLSLLFSHMGPVRDLGVWAAAGIGIGFVALALHAAMLYQDLFTAGGLNMSFFNAVSLAAWTVAGLLLISALSKPVDNLAILALPLAAITVLLDLRFPGSRLLGDDAGWQLRLHVLTSILAYSLLSFAAMQAVLLAIQLHYLHNHHPGGFVRALPPLAVMEAPVLSTPTTVMSVS